MDVSKISLLARFVSSLGSVMHRPDLYNPYRGPGGPIRRQNLLNYLQLIQLEQPRYLLLGEAVGYRGGRMTGIPFVSEDLMLNGDAGTKVLGANRAYKRAKEGGPLWREASATIVWQTIRAYKPLPILWNALPFHPHNAGKRYSNRTPRLEELRLGMTYLPTLLKLFPDLTVIAVGRRAEHALRDHDFAFQPIRHPSHGGKMAFMAGVARHLGSG